MQAVSDQWAPALRASHSLKGAVFVEVWSGRSKIGTAQPLDGQVTADWVTGVRRSLDCSFDPTWETTIKANMILRPFRGIFYGYGQPEVLPLGRFLVDTDDVGIQPDRTVSVSGAHDLWEYVVRSRFPQPQASTPGIRVTEQIRRLVLGTGMWSPAEIMVTATSSAVVPPLVWEEDRHQAIADLCEMAACEAFCDRLGRVVIRNRPGKGAAVATLDLPIDMQATVSTADVCNQVVASSTVTDPAFRPDPVTVRITDRTRPDRYIAGVTPLVTKRIEGAWTSAGEMRSAALTALDKAAAAARTVTVTAIPNAALDEADTVILPWPGGASEALQLQQIRLPLDAAGDMQVTTVTTGGAE